MDQMVDHTFSIAHGFWTMMAAWGRAGLGCVWMHFG